MNLNIALKLMTLKTSSNTLAGSPESHVRYNYTKDRDFIIQVPQPTCYWKWVGSTIPLKQDNLTLRASRAFNMARTLKEVYFLE